MNRIAEGVAAGARMVTDAGHDLTRLSALAVAASMSPWRTESFSWLLANEPEQLVKQFSLTELARLGGVQAEVVSDWGNVSIVTGCLCLRTPPARIPEVTIGRAADGLLGGESADLMLRIAVILRELDMPAALGSAVLSYAMRDFVDHVRPAHAADFDAFRRQAITLDRATVEDYLGAIAAVGPLRTLESR
jgi:hypothetical protein